MKMKNARKSTLANKSYTGNILDISTACSVRTVDIECVDIFINRGFPSSTNLPKWLVS